MINDEILKIRDRLTAKLLPERIYLFGSYAKDTFNSESDYDFYIVMPDSTKDINEVSTTAYMSLRGMKRRPVDFVVNTKSIFETRSKMETLEKTVLSEGVVLYG